MIASHQVDSYGVIYVAEGADYLALAEASAASLRAHWPEVHVTLFTDQPRATGFDATRPIPAGCTRAKIAAMMATPYARTLFLDCDTLVLSDLGDLFGILDRFDLALCHDVRRSSALVQRGWQANAPTVFPQHNSGVMLYNNIPKMAAFLATWARAFDTAGAGRDQITLRDALWESDLRFWVLPEEFNLRRVTLLDAWEPLDAIPRILHSHQLLRHLRGKGARVTTLAQVQELERAALAEEWAKEPPEADTVARFIRAHATRRE